MNNRICLNQRIWCYKGESFSKLVAFDTYPIHPNIPQVFQTLLRVPTFLALHKSPQKDEERLSEGRCDYREESLCVKTFM